MAYQRFDGTMSFLPSRFEAQAMLSEMQKKKDEEMKLLRLKQAEEQKHQTEALWSDLNRMLTELKAMTANREATMSKFFSQTSIPPRPPFPPPDPPDIRKSRQDLTIKAPNLPDFNQSELISTNQVPNKLTLRYSCQEIHERMTNGLCIFCEDLDTPGHYNLKHKRSKICLVECVDDRLPDEELVEPAVEEIFNKSVTMIQGEESNPENESRPEVSVSQFQVPFSSMEPSRRCHNHYESLDAVDERMCNDLVYDEDGDSIITKSAKSHETYEEPQFELVCLKQSHDPVENHLENIESAQTSSSLRDTPTYQYRAPFNPYQNCNDQCDRESEEIEDNELQDKQPEDEVFGVVVETLVINEDEPPLECAYEKNAMTSSTLYDYNTVCNDRQKGAVCDAENKKLLNIEAGAKKGTNSCLGGKIAVALARKKGMDSKVGGSTFDLECDQIKFNNKEELVGLTEYSELRPSREYLLMNFGIFMNPQPPHDKRITLASLVGLVGQEKLSDRLSLANYVWKPGELLCVQDQWDWISEVHSGELQEWNDVVTGHFLFDMVEKGNYLDEVIEEVAKTFILTMIDEHKDIKTACVFLEMSLNRERLIQLDAPTVFSDLMCAMNRIRVRLKMVLLLEFLWLILFSSKMFKSSYVPQNKNQTNQKLSSYWKLLLRLLYPLHNNKWRSFYLLMIKPVFKGKEETVSFNIAVTSCNRFCFFPYSSWKISQNILVSSRCVLRQEESYVMVLLTIVANLILLSDAHILVARKKGTEIHTACCYELPCGLDFNEEIKSDTFMDDFKSACKLLLGAFVLNLIAEQTRDWSFLGLLLQWKWHPPPQTTSEFHQAHNAKPCLSSLRTKMI